MMTVPQNQTFLRRVFGYESSKNITATLLEVIFKKIEIFLQIPLPFRRNAHLTPQAATLDRPPCK